MMVIIIVIIIIIIIIITVIVTCTVTFLYFHETLLVRKLRLEHRVTHDTALLEKSGSRVSLKRCRGFEPTTLHAA